MQTKIYILLLFNLSLISIYSQTEVITKEGKKVMLNDNGTWEYVITKTLKSKNNILINDCDKYYSIETDRVTGKSTIGSKETLVISSDNGKTGFGIFMMNISKTVIVSIQVAGAGSCIDDDEKMNILFRDGSRIELINNGKFNCDGRFTLYLGGKLGGEKNLKIFKTKEIETMRIWTSDSYVEKDFSSTESKQFLQTVLCLSEI